MRGFAVWFTGLPGSGKTTLARALSESLRQKGMAPVILDGDEVRQWLTKGLGFSREDRRENVLRVAGVAKLIVDAGGVAIVALVSPYDKDRREAVELIGNCRMVWCVGRQKRWLWPGTVYESLENDAWNVVLDTMAWDVDACVAWVMSDLEKAKLVAPRHADAPSLFLGRWQPFHDGHKALVEKVLQEGKSVVIGVRNTEVGESDPYTYETRERMIYQALGEWGHMVKVFRVPDFSEICVGRMAGYGVRQIHLEEEVEAISGTAIRGAGDDGRD